MRSIDWKRIARSWWGRLLIGAFIGGLVTSWASIDNATVFISGMVIGSLVVFFLGQWE